MQDIYVVLSSAERDESWNHTKHLEDVQDITCKLKCQFCPHFAMDDEQAKLRMKEATNDLASLISFLNLGSEQMLIDLCAIGIRGNCWCRVHHGCVGGFGMGKEIHLSLNLY